ncbi:MAG: hypothetical protein P8M49_09775 [Thalassotalea sp.]|nr:hypothetical protein [Thalassotalea sp.]MDG2393789.1 hypothetical protein [Thalassotalea sp.]
MITRVRYSFIFFALALLGLYLSIQHAVFILLCITYIYQLFYIPSNGFSKKFFKREISLPFINKGFKPSTWIDYLWGVLFLCYWLGAWSVLGEVANCLAGFPYWQTPVSFCYSN